MSPEEIAAALLGQSFVPLRITLTEGMTWEIRHPELCMVGRRSAMEPMGSGADGSRWGQTEFLVN